MKSEVKNVLLILGMCAIAIMCVGLLLYDYIPNGLTVSKANQYETSAKTTEVLSDAQDAQSLLSSQTSSSNTTTPTVKTNVVLKEYDVSKTDLALYKAEGSLEQGRPDPFAEVTAEDTANTTADGTNTTSQPGTTGGGNSSTSSRPSSDGTYYNTARTK